MALDFPTNPTLNQTYTVGTRTYKWNGNAWVKVVADSNNSALYANITADWTGAQYDNTGLFTGDLLKGGSALIKVIWNIRPNNFTKDKLLTPFETTARNSPTITNFALDPSDTTNRTYTFNFKPTSVPAQIKIAAQSISTDNNVVLQYDVYSPALGAETRPYITADVTNNLFGTVQTNSQIRSILDTATNIYRYYIVPTIDTTNSSRLIVYNFINFDTVPVSLADAGITASENTTNTQFYFGGSGGANYNDIVKSITYSHLIPNSTKLPETLISTTNTNYGIYIPEGTGINKVYDLDSLINYTPATKTSKTRGIVFVPAKNAYAYSGIAKIQVLAGAYTDNKVINIDGVPFYLGIFGNTMSPSFEIVLDKDNVTYGNIKYIKFRFNVYLALLATGITNPFTFSGGGSLGTIKVDSLDQYGLTYKAEYIPNPNVLAYTENISVAAGWKKTNVFSGTDKNTALTTSGDFQIKRSTVKYILSSINSTNNLAYKDSVITFTVDVTLFATTQVYARIFDITDANNPVSVETLNNKSIVDATTKNSINSGITQIVLNIDSTKYKANKTYKIEIPSNFANDLYGNLLENLNARTDIYFTFKIDTSPITLLNTPIVAGTQKPTITNFTPSLTIAPNKALTTIGTTSALVAIYEINGTTRTTLPNLRWTYSSTLKYGAVPSNTNNTVSTLTIRDSALSTSINKYNNNRDLLINKTYRLEVDLTLLKDKFSNSGVLYTENFFIDPQDFLITSTNFTNNFSSEIFTITFPRTVFLTSSALLPTITNTTDNTAPFNSVTNFTISGYNTTAIGTSKIVTVTTNGVFLPSKSYSLKIPAGMFEDYLGNPNKEFTQTFTTAALDAGSGDYVVSGAAVDTLWKAPFNVSKISAVLIGKGSNYNGGALAYANEIAVVPGNTYRILIDGTATKLYNNNNATLITANAGSTLTPTSGTAISNVSRSTYSFDSSLNSKTKGGGQGGLGVKYLNSSTADLIDTFNGSPQAGSGRYGSTGSDAVFNIEPVLVGLYGSNGPVSTNLNEPASIYGTSVIQYATNYLDSSIDGYLPNYAKTTAPGAVRLMWGPGRSFPTNAV